MRKHARTTRRCRWRNATGAGPPSARKWRRAASTAIVLCGWPIDVGLQHRQRALSLPDRRQRRVQRAGVSGRGRADRLHLVADVHRLLEGRAELGRRRPSAQGHLGRQRRRPPHGAEADRGKIGIDGLAGPLDPDGWTPHRRLHAAEGAAAGRQPRQSRRHDGEAPRRQERRGDRGAATRPPRSAT